MPKAIIKKYVYSQLAYYSILYNNGTMIGNAQYQLSTAWLSCIEGTIGTSNFRLMPDVKTVVLPTGYLMSIDESGKQLGIVRSSTPHETVSFGGESTYHIVYGKQHYSAFHIGLGRKGQYLCVYKIPEGYNPITSVFELSRQECPLVAQISLPMSVKNWEPCYEVAAFESESFYIACLLTLYFSYKNESGWLSKTQGSVEKKIKFSSRYMKSLYDPTFERNIQ